MIGLSVFNLLVLLVVFGGVAAVAFAVILNKESSNKPQPPQSNPYQQMPPAQQVSQVQQASTAIDDAQPVEPAHFALSVAQWWKQMPPSAKTAELPSTISDFSGTGIT